MELIYYNKLIKKYNIPGPRYTSYPTVPYWDAIPPKPGQWTKLVKNNFAVTNDKEGISIYIHLPFCESLCTYCACNTRITVNHSVELPYIKALLQEWKMYLAVFGTPPKIKEIHLGGGTPTFFTAAHLKELINGIRATSNICDDTEFGFEAHPNNTALCHLKTLFDLGFRRISFGIQDFDTKVQKVIHCIRSFSQVEKITSLARTIGYPSVNYDLIYGLPFQTRKSMTDTINKVIILRPDRIAFYSYAYVPWIKPAQRGFSINDLPVEAEKQTLYEIGKGKLKEAGYKEIGMDHFALKTDSLYSASYSKKLHRNFMGYTTSATKLLIGLGVSAISDSWDAFIQNSKKVEDYYEKIHSGNFPFFRGHQLSPEDIVLRKHILNLMCNLETSWVLPEEQCHAVYEGLNRLKEMEEDNLIAIEPYHLKIKKAGRPFIRNVCMAFDARLWRNKPQTQLFSTII